MKINRYLAVFLFSALLLTPLFGESSITAQLNLYDSLARTGSDTWINAGTGAASITVDQKNNSNVRSQFKLTAWTNPYTGEIEIDVPRAYVKFRFPSIRGVIGKAPFSWGEGLVFNAGDILFGDNALATNLMTTEFLDTEAWMSTIYLPLGDFSYAEAIMLPPEQIFDAGSGTVENGLEATSAGGRLVTRVGDIKLETGYIYQGETDSHKPYLSLQGNLYLDWHLSASASLPSGMPLSDTITEDLNITAGIYSMAAVGYNGTLSYRLEALLSPDSEWSEYSAGAGSDEDYGLYLYPEVSYSFGSGMAGILRGFISPMDSSALVIPGFTWNVFQGFTLLAFGSFGLGEPDDIFAWKPDNENSSGFSIMTGVSVVY